MDGTLLTLNQQQLTDFSKKILILLNVIKVHFVFATGRQYNNVVSISNNLRSYIITANGSKIYDPQGKLIVTYNLDSEVVYDLLQIVSDDPEIIINIFKGDEWLINKYDYDRSIVFQCWGSYYRVYRKNKMLCSGVNKMCFISNNYKKLLILEKELNTRWGYHINVSFSFSTCLEVVLGGVFKGYALQYIANLLHYELRDCITFGDSMNDQEMLRMTGKGCIMYNAQQRLKDALPYLEIIGSN